MASSIRRSRERNTLGEPVAEQDTADFSFSKQMIQPTGERGNRLAVMETQNNLVQMHQNQVALSQ